MPDSSAQNMLNFKDRTSQKFKTVTSILSSSKRLKGMNPHVLNDQFDEFLEDIPRIGLSKFKDFNSETDRLDTFFVCVMKNNSDLLTLMKSLLVISHGQADFKRGYRNVPRP